MKHPVTTVFDLSPAEKLQLVEDLWDDLASSPENIPVHDWQLDECDRRIENLKQNPASARPWKDVMKAIRASYGY